MTETALAQRIRTQSRRALDSGALLPIDTRSETLEDGGIPFTVRIVQNLRRKAAAGNRSRDPFLPPYDCDLHVGDMPPDHAILLNKYNVLPGHILIVTRHFEPQTHLLTHSDMAALLRVLGQIDGLGFYNGGAEAGASQPHKHLQVVALPLGDSGGPLPMEAVFEHPGAYSLPFAHAVTAVAQAWWRHPAQGAGEALAAYHRLLTACGLAADGHGQRAPYNLLVTRRHMWLVPRRREKCSGISVNALGFAGALLVPSAELFETLKSIGPLRVLTRVGIRSKPAPTVSAGVVVVRRIDGRPHYLLLRAWRHWDFPKGEVEPDEPPLRTAAREVSEETGLTRLEWRWGHGFIETPRYGRNKVARYYVAEAPEGSVRLGVNPALGRPEHHEFRWSTLQDARTRLGERVRRVLEWAARRVGDDSG